MLNKPNVRSKHLLLQPTHQAGLSYSESKRERERERERESEKTKEKEEGIQGVKVEEEMWMVRNNERVEETEGNEWGLGGDVLQLMLRRGRPYIHCMDVCGECMCVYCTVLERGSKGRQIWRGEQRKKENQKTWLKIFFFFFTKSVFCALFLPLQQFLGEY